MQIKKSNYPLIYLSIILIATYVGFSRLDFSQAEDMGIFLSVFGFISKGAPLYSGIFEIKDPLFLLSGGYLLKLFGPKAPYILDIMLFISCGMFSFKLAQKMNFSKLNSYLASIVLLLTLSGQFYNSMRSTLFAITLILLALLFATERKAMLSGIVIALVGGFKMPYLLICCTVLPGIFSEKNRNKLLAGLILGFLIGCLFIGGILIYRNELLPYISMVQENFRYAAIYQKVMGFKTGIPGHIEIIKNSTGFNVWILIFAAYYFLLLNFKQLLHASKVLILLPLLIIVFLLLSSLWRHHFQIMGLFAWAIFLLGFNIFEQYFNKDQPLNIKNQISLLPILFFMIIAIGASGLSFQLKPKMPLENIINNNWSIAPEIYALDSAYIKYKRSQSFARLGANEDLGFGAFISDQWTLSCPRIGQYGHESKEVVNQMIECIKNKPNYVVVSPVFFDLNRYFGTHSSFRDEAIKILNANFICETIPNWGKGQICIRK